MRLLQVAGAASTWGSEVMDIVAFPLMASDHGRQLGLGPASRQAPVRFASGAVTGSPPWRGGVWGGRLAPVGQGHCPG